MKIPPVCTREEAEAVFARVDPELKLTAWDFYTLPIGVVAPGGRTRLFTTSDLALARLFGRLRKAEVLPTALARGVLTYLQDDLRRVVVSGERCKLVIAGGGRRGFKASVVPASMRTDAPITVSLDGLMTGLDAAVRAVRAAAPDIWTGQRLEDARTVSSSLAAQLLSA
jgi:hypothetical protein